MRSSSPLPLSPFPLEHTLSGFLLYHSSEIAPESHQLHPYCWNCLLHGRLAASTQTTTLPLLKSTLWFLWPMCFCLARTLLTVPALCPLLTLPFCWTVKYHSVLELSPGALLYSILPSLISLVLLAQLCMLETPQPPPPPSMLTAYWTSSFGCLTGIAKLM